MAMNPRELRKQVPLTASAASDRFGWVGLQAAHYRHAPSTEIDAPPLSHHTLALVVRPPHKFELRYDDVRQTTAPSAGSIYVIPAESAVTWRWTGPKDSLLVFLEPQLIARVAGEAFDLDPARVSVPALADMDYPQLRATMLAVDAELSDDGAGGSLAAESLANLLAVHLIRHRAPRRLRGRTDKALSRSAHRTVVEFVMENLDRALTLEALAEIACLSPYHFARQFKATTGLPPHQYVIARRIERARQLLLTDDEPSLAQIATRVGFADQSHLARHFKRIVGITPARFRATATPAAYTEM
jgi:AraC family transcriptional regulator